MGKALVMIDRISVQYHIELKENGANQFDNVAEVMKENAGIGKITPSILKFLEVKEAHLDKYAVSLETCNPVTKTITLNFPVANFDFDFAGIPLLLNSIAGDILGDPRIENAYIQNIQFPVQVLKSFKGPKCGVEGVKRKLNVFDRPIIAFTVKPRLGLTVEQYVNLIQAVAIGGKQKLGADIVEDDERLINPGYCSLQERLSRSIAAIKKQSKKQEREKFIQLIYLAERIKL